MKYQIQVKGHWVDGTPEDGQYCRIVNGVGLSAGYTYMIYKETPPAPTPIDLVITSVTGTLTGYDDGPNQYTVNEQADINVTGTLSIPDQNFRVPFKRTDTGRIQLMPASVVNGGFALNINFKTGGIWVVDNEQINSAYDQPVFSITKQTFMVI